MTKRSADTFAGHESVPPGALPFFEPGAKRVRSAGGYGNPPSPSDPLTSQYQMHSPSSDEMSDIGATDQADAVSAHHLATCAPSCSSAPWVGGAVQPAAGMVDCLGALGMSIPPHCQDARQFLDQLANCLLMGAQITIPGSMAANTAIAASLGTPLW
jgi:hypothetical protein